MDIIIKVPNFKVNLSVMFYIPHNKSGNNLF